MEKEMEEDGSAEMFEQSQQAQNGQTAPEMEPEDNTVEGDSSESPTPQLDADVEKYTMGYK
jgi:hypothetical protein